MTALTPVAADMETNSQVLCRVSPCLVDLIIALAAGFMAALASMRADIPDAQGLSDALDEKDVGVRSVAVSVLEEQRIVSGS